MRAVLFVLLLSGCATGVRCPAGDVELRSREPIRERELLAPKPPQYIECVNAYVR